MWQVLVILLLDGVAHKQYRTHYPPLMGDKMEMSGGDVVVVDRIWRQAYTEQPVLDVVLRRTGAPAKRRKT